MKIGIYIIIAVKNQENKIEETLNSILFKIMYGKEDIIKKVILTDLDSNDNTLKVLRKMKKRNEDIEVSNWRRCKEIVDLIDEE